MARSADRTGAGEHFSRAACGRHAAVAARSGAAASLPRGGPGHPGTPAQLPAKEEAVRCTSDTCRQRQRRLLRRDARQVGLAPEHGPAGDAWPGRWARRRGLDLPVHQAGNVSTVFYNHYSALRSIEDIFRLSHLGDASMPQVKAFGRDVYTRR